MMFIYYYAKDQKELMSQSREANNSVISNVLIKKKEFGPFSYKNTFSNRNYTNDKYSFNLRLCKQKTYFDKNGVIRLRTLIYAYK